MNDKLPVLFSHLAPRLRTLTTNFDLLLHSLWIAVFGLELTATAVCSSSIVHCQSVVLFRANKYEVLNKLALEHELSPWSASRR